MFSIAGAQDAARVRDIHLAEAAIDEGLTKRLSQRRTMRADIDARSDVAQSKVDQMIAKLDTFLPREAVAVVG